MKRVILLLSLSALTLGAYAQKGNVNAAEYELSSDKPDFERAKTWISEAEKDPKTAEYTKTYLVKSKLYSRINEKKANFKDLLVAAEAIKKADELDQKGDAKGKRKLRDRNEIALQTQQLKMAFNKAAVDFWNAKEFDKACGAFEGMLMMNDQPAYQSLGSKGTMGVDTSTIFNTAVAAYQAYSEQNKTEFMTKSVKYLQKTAELNYGDEDVYKMMFALYRDLKDTVNMVSALKAGYEKYPKESLFLKQLVNYYVNSTDPNQAIEFLDKALAAEPNNSGYIFAKGTFFDALKETDKALDCYRKVLELATNKQDIYNANYNLGVYYYNIALEANNDATAEKVYAKYIEKQKNAVAAFKVCIPYFEGCLQNFYDSTTETMAYEALKPIYYRLSNGTSAEAKEYAAKFEEVKAKLGK